MNESDFKDILAEICEEEIAELNKFPPFKPSLRHRFAMKRIFVLFNKNSHNIINTSQTISPSRHTHLSLKKRLIIIFVLIVCAALLTGFIYGYVSGNFRGTVYNDNTQIFMINTENCPATIEYEYYLPILPNGFEMFEHDSLSFTVYTKYRNSISGQEIVLSQCTKKMFDPHYNTEDYGLEDIKINGHNGVCLDLSDKERFGAIVVWDNDDYILEIDGNLPKDDLLELAKSAKVLEN